MLAPWNQHFLDGLTAGSDRSTHAWLFTGPDGLGKRDLAIEYARSLLMDDQAVMSTTHPDLHVLMPENRLDAEGQLLERYGMRYYASREGLKPKSVISVDQVRRLNVSLMTHGHGQHKVALILPAHLMNLNAANALLKVLEEPPTNTIFVLVTPRWDLLPATVRSRCSIIHFRAPTREAGRQWLSDRLQEDQDLDLLLELAGGAPLRAITLHEQGFLADREQVLDDLRRVLVEAVDVTEVAARWKELGTNDALNILQRVLADLVRVSFVRRPPHLNNPDVLDWLQHAAKDIHLGKVFALMDRVARHLADLNSPVDQNLVLEDFLLDLSMVSN